MPKITQARRDANRAVIVAAARHCFSRDGFHQTSMPDIAAAAGLSTGATYRYFTSKEEIILEIAGDAFRMIFEPVLRLLELDQPAGIDDLVTAAVEPMERSTERDAAGVVIPPGELLRCAVQAWAELLRNDELRDTANQGFEAVRSRMSTALRQGQAAGTVPTELDADRSTRVVMALLHGFVLQRAAFGLDDTAGFIQDVRDVLEVRTGSPR
ncbi:TetR/AcrR family transcriptional regulator [Curtobacterium sp. A7_M15]|uniref:TetR/AcrR family transcriptional regulator n=1 Tax=Curtobacterium sp. A7_M15 TaxID=3065241 RepID=UPI002737CD81|nr:TetR/AcrR family transcriptional regulator [Curtobacterium sp. A7_M15]MDP4332001.1 TetR/AcrR family transcriptional regulator [Curtobacterium sp. A7_M15]